MKKWSLETNRHPESSGERWGWIEGSDPKIYWSDSTSATTGKSVSRKRAEELIREHNEHTEK